MVAVKSCCQRTWPADPLPLRPPGGQCEVMRADTAQKVEAHPLLAEPCRLRLLLSPTMDGLLQWLHEGRVLAGRLTTAEPNHTAWIGIYPLRTDRPGTAEVLRREGIVVLPGVEVHAYHVRLFEIADHLRETNFGEDDLKNARSVVVLGDDALLAKLEELGVPLGVLDSARRVEYPL
jgi:hypothetical protein